MVMRPQTGSSDMALCRLRQFGGDDSLWWTHVTPNYGGLKAVGCLRTGHLSAHSVEKSDHVAGVGACREDFNRLATTS